MNRSGLDIEGFGLVAVEAAALGVPVIGADTEGLRDAILDGETGFLIEPENARAWADKIAEIYRWSPAERRRFIDRSLETIASRYSWQRVAQDVAEIYASVCGADR